MANMLQTGAGWLIDQLAEHASNTVSYRRGGQSVSLAATKCPVRSETDEEFGILLIGECDWIIKASVLILGGATVEPQKNDLIVESDGQEWQVLGGSGEDVFRPLEPHRQAFRIHTKRISAG